jgi:Na+-driven multidrug efflux pump
LTDAFWVGRLAAAAMAAASVGFCVTFLVIALGAGRQHLVNHVAGIAICFRTAMAR